MIYKIIKYLTIFVFAINIQCFAKNTENYLNISTASNFLTTLKTIKNKFEKENKCKIIISSDSTTNIYTKIINGAPFDIFISADEKHINLLKKKFITTDEYIYAIGILTLLNENINKKKIKKNIKNIAIANPKLSPYGKATKQFIKNSKLKINNDIIYGCNINQVYNFLNSKNSKIGFISFSQIINNKKNKTDYWIIPKYLYPQITQKMAMIKNTQNLNLSKKFINFMKTENIKKLISDSGYKI